MSDYFASLLRSAGATPTGGHAGRRALQPMAPFGGDAMEASLEQFVEVEAPANGAAGPTVPPEPPRDTPLPPSIDPELPAARGPAPTAGSAMARPPAQVEAVSPAATWPAGDEAPVHPLVRAALQWVRADASGAAPPPTEPPSAPRPGADVGELAAAPTRHAAPAALLRADPLPQPRAVRPVQEAAEPDRAIPVPGEVFDIEVPGPKPAGSGVVAASDALPRAPSPRQVEVSIGTIHVRVDAPPAPRPVLPAPPPLPRPPTTSRDSTSRSLSRSRLPRL